MQAIQGLQTMQKVDHNLLDQQFHEILETYKDSANNLASAAQMFTSLIVVVPEGLEDSRQELIVAAQNIRELFGRPDQDGFEQRPQPAGLTHVVEEHLEMIHRKLRNLDRDLVKKSVEEPKHPDRLFKLPQPEAAIRAAKCASIGSEQPDDDRSLDTFERALLNSVDRRSDSEPDLGPVCTQKSEEEPVQEGVRLVPALLIGSAREVSPSTDHLLAGGFSFPQSPATKSPGQEKNSREEFIDIALSGYFNRTGDSKDASEDDSHTELANILDAATRKKPVGESSQKILGSQYIIQTERSARATGLSPKGSEHRVIGLLGEAHKILESIDLAKKGATSGFSIRILQSLNKIKEKLCPGAIEEAQSLEELSFGLESGKFRDSTIKSSVQSPAQPILMKSQFQLASPYPQQHSKPKTASGTEVTTSLEDPKAKIAFSKKNSLTILTELGPDLGTSRRSSDADKEHTLEHLPVVNKRFVAPTSSFIGIQNFGSDEAYPSQSPQGEYQLAEPKTGQAAGTVAFSYQHLTSVIQDDKPIRTMPHLAHGGVNESPLKNNYLSQPLSVSSAQKISRQPGGYSLHRRSLSKPEILQGNPSARIADTDEVKITADFMASGKERQYHHERHVRNVSSTSDLELSPILHREAIIEVNGASQEHRISFGNNRFLKKAGYDSYKSEPESETKGLRFSTTFKAESDVRLSIEFPRKLKVFNSNSKSTSNITSTEQGQLQPESSDLPQAQMIPKRHSVTANNLADLLPASKRQEESLQILEASVSLSTSTFSRTEKIEEIKRMLFQNQRKFALEPTLLDMAEMHRPSMPRGVTGRLWETFKPSTLDERQLQTGSVLDSSGKVFQLHGASGTTGTRARRSKDVLQHRLTGSKNFVTQGYKSRHLHTGQTRSSTYSLYNSGAANSNGYGVSVAASAQKELSDSLSKHEYVVRPRYSTPPLSRLQPDIIQTYLSNYPQVKESHSRGTGQKSPHSPQEQFRSLDRKYTQTMPAHSRALHTEPKKTEAEFVPHSHFDRFTNRSLFRSTYQESRQSVGASERNINRFSHQSYGLTGAHFATSITDKKPTKVEGMLADRTHLSNIKQGIAKVFKEFCHVKSDRELLSLKFADPKPGENKKTKKEGGSSIAGGFGESHTVESQARVLAELAQMKRRRAAAQISEDLQRPSLQNASSARYLLGGSDGDARRPTTTTRRLPW